MVLSRVMTWSYFFKWICSNSQNVDCTIYPFILFYTHDLFPHLLNLCAHTHIYVHTHMAKSLIVIYIYHSIPLNISLCIFQKQRPFLCCHIVIMTPKTLVIYSTIFKLSCFCSKCPLQLSDCSSILYKPRRTLYIASTDFSFTLGLSSTRLSSSWYLVCGIIQVSYIVDHPHFSSVWQTHYNIQVIMPQSASFIYTLLSYAEKVKFIFTKSTW